MISTWWTFAEALSTAGLSVQRKLLRVSYAVFADISGSNQGTARVRQPRAMTRG
jgi:hypothetical protein